MRVYLSIIISLLFISLSFEAKAGLFDDTDKLEGKVIVKVGELESFDCPVGGNYDCLDWPQSFYKLDYDICLEIHGYYGSYGDKGLIAVD